MGLSLWTRQETTHPNASPAITRHRPWDAAGAGDMVQSRVPQYWANREKSTGAAKAMAMGKWSFQARPSQYSRTEPRNRALTYQNSSTTKEVPKLWRRNHSKKPSLTSSFSVRVCRKQTRRERKAMRVSR